MNKMKNKFQKCKHAQDNFVINFPAPDHLDSSVNFSINYSPELSREWTFRDSIKTLP